MIMEGGWGRGCYKGNSNDRNNVCFNFFRLLYQEQNVCIILTA